MRGSFLLAMGLLGAGCGGQPAVAPAAERVSTWPVPWGGAIQSVTGVSPDGRFALLTTRPGKLEFKTHLYRVDPPGPVAVLDELFGGRVLGGLFSSDGKRLAALITLRPSELHSLDYDCAVLDLETRAVRRFPVSRSRDGAEPLGRPSWFAGGVLTSAWEQRLRRFDSATGSELPLIELPEPETIESVSTAHPFVLSVFGQRRRVFRVKGDRLEEVGEAFECSSRSEVEWSRTEPTFAMRCDSELLIWRPAGVVRAKLDETRHQSVLLFGNRGRAVAFGGEREPQTFETATGKAVPFATFVPEAPGFAVTGYAQRLWRDDEQKPLRVPLAGMPELLEVRAAEWHGERRVTLSVAPFEAPDERELRKLELELASAHVTKSERLEKLESKPEEPEDEERGFAARFGRHAQASERGDLVAEVTAKGRVVAAGPLVAEERGHVALRRPDGGVELWTDDGRRVGKLPKDAKRIPFLSPSGALGIEPLGAGQDRLVRTATGEVLTLLIVRQGEQTRAVVTAESGWFAGDAEAFPALRYARGHDAFDAVPLTGRDVRQRWERPQALKDFLAGRPVVLARPEGSRRGL